MLIPTDTFLSATNKRMISQLELELITATAILTNRNNKNYMQIKGNNVSCIRW